MAAHSIGQVAKELGVSERVLYARRHGLNAVLEDGETDYIALDDHGGRIRLIKIGRRLVVPDRELRRVLGDTDVAGTPAVAS